MGEVNLAPDQQRAFFGDEDGDELHMVISFTVNQAMYLAFARGEAAPLAAALKALPDIPQDSQWANFVRNHDELTLDKLSDSERAEVFDAFGPEERHQLYGRGLRRRLPSMVGGDEDRIRLAYSLMFSLPGTPVLFYGEEVALREDLDRPGRMSIRTPMDWDAVARQRRDNESLLMWMERLIRRRRECPELGWGRITLLDPDDPAVLAHRADWEGSTIVAVHSLGEEPRTVALDCEHPLVDLFDQEELTPAGGRVEIPLARYGGRWFRVRRPDADLAP
jgi:glycosidase